MFIPLIAMVIVLVIVIAYISKNAKKKDQGNRPT
jgi:hypothetical protein